eukprot:354169-Chlamydomonas_euryale.AAC.32
MARRWCRRRSPTCKNPSRRWCVSLGISVLRRLTINWVRGYVSDARECRDRVAPKVLPCSLVNRSGHSAQMRHTVVTHTHARPGRQARGLSRHCGRCCSVKAVPVQT